jgi:hypothetical protein
MIKIHSVMVVVLVYILKKMVEVNHSFVYLTFLYYDSHQRDHDISLSDFQHL